MSHRAAGTAENLSHFALPRGWVILGLGAACWLAIAGLVSVSSTAFEALLFVLG
jgi:hypothetical protein